MVWEERLPDPLSEYLHFRVRKCHLLCVFAVHPTVGVLIMHIACFIKWQLHSLIWCYTGEIVTWERCHRSQERISVTLSPILLLKHLPREGILFSSTTPVKVSDPVITSHAQSAHRHRTDLHAIPTGLSGIQLFLSYVLGQGASINY